MQAETVANLALEPIPIHRAANLLLGNHQPEAGMSKIIATNQKQEVRFANLEGSTVENRLEFCGPQQAQRRGKTEAIIQALMVRR